jgi:nicotinamidase-related amidase
LGFDINSCVLATLLDAFDLGYFSYAIEELCDINNGDENLRQAAIDILRWEKMTNHSTLDDVKIISLNDQ